jgi:hypothetical protein
MKRILLVLFFAVISASIFAQDGVGWQDVRKKQNFKDSTYFAKAPLYATEAYVTLFDVAMKLYPDTALVTAAVFRPNLTHLNTYIRVNRATQVIVYLPPDTTVNFPIGSTLNFKMDNAGIVTFKGSTSVVESKKDSTTINFKGGWVTAIKRAANKWELVGDLTD